MSVRSWVEKIGLWRVIAYTGLLVLSTVPQAAGSIYKEIAMKQVRHHNVLFL